MQGKQEAEARRDTLQALRENPAFKEFGDQQIHGVFVNQKSLYETIYQDKLTKLRTPAAAVKFRAPYYRGLATAYRGDSVVRAAVAPTSSPALELRQELVGGLMEWNDQPRNAGPMMEFLSLNEEVFVNSFTYFF